MKASWAISIVMLVVLGAGAANAENRLAFVVGNDAYRNVNPLQKAVNDARSVSRGLQQLGFRVTLAENLGWRDYVEKFAAFETFDSAWGHSLSVLFRAWGRNRRRQLF